MTISCRIGLSPYITSIIIGVVNVISMISLLFIDKVRSYNNIYIQEHNIIIDVDRGSATTNWLHKTYHQCRCFNCRAAVFVRADMDEANLWLIERDPHSTWIQRTNQDPL